MFLIIALNKIEQFLTFLTALQYILENYREIPKKCDEI